MKKTLVILGAGIGSRYGGGVKQLEPVGPDGEINIDYSIHDAIRAGFNKIMVPLFIWFDLMIFSLIPKYVRVIAYTQVQLCVLYCYQV